MDIFETTKEQVNRHVMTAEEKRLNDAKTQAAASVYSLPYEFLNDAQRLSLMDIVAMKFATMEINDLRNQLNKNKNESSIG